MLLFFSKKKRLLHHAFLTPRIENQEISGKNLNFQFLSEKKRIEGHVFQRLGHILQKTSLETVDMSKRNLSRESLLASFQIYWRLFILETEEKLKNKIQCKG